jgi:hypothetical protein
MALVLIPPKPVDIPMAKTLSSCGLKGLLSERNNGFAVLGNRFLCQQTDNLPEVYPPFGDTKASGNGHT